MPLTSIDTDTLCRRCAVCGAEHVIAHSEIAPGPADGLRTLLLPVCDSCGSLEVLLLGTSTNASAAAVTGSHASLVSELAARIDNPTEATAPPR